MKTISQALKDHLAMEVTTLSVCWRITLPDARVFLFTDHDCDLEIGAEVFLAENSLEMGDYHQDLTLSPDNVEVLLFLDSSESPTSISDRDVRNDDLAGAAVDIFLVNWADVSMGTLPLAEGWGVGEVTLEDFKARIQLIGLTRKLAVDIGDAYSSSCRASLGDSQCGVNLTTGGNYCVGTVTSIFGAGNQEFGTACLALAGSDLALGTLTWTLSGSANEGGVVTVKTAVDLESEVRFVLFTPTTYPIEVGDEFVVTLGCDKTLDTCRNRFRNAVNFRGEPFLPLESQVMSRVNNGPADRSPIRR